MTGSFMHEETHRRITIEDEYVEHYGEASFVSHTSQTPKSNRSTLMANIVDLQGLTPKASSPLLPPLIDNINQDNNFENDFISNIRNCFHLEGNMLLLAMRDLTIVMSDDMETLAITNFKTLFGKKFSGQAQCFKTDSSSDSNSILIGFNEAEIPQHIMS